MFSLVFQLQPRLHSSQQSRCSSVLFKTDVNIVNRLTKNNRLLHKLEMRLNKTWSSLLHLLTRHAHHQPLMLDQKVYTTRFGQSKRRCNSRIPMDANFIDLLVHGSRKQKLYFKYWKDGQALFVNVTKCFLCNLCFLGSLNQQSIPSLDSKRPYRYLEKSPKK